MSSTVDEIMQVATLLVSAKAHESLKSTVAAIKTVDANSVPWKYVLSRLVEEQRSQKIFAVDTFTPNGNLALAGRSKQHTNCFKCRKRGHTARYCKSSDSKISSRNMKKVSPIDARQPEENITRIAAARILSLDGMEKLESEGKEHKGSRAFMIRSVKATPDRSRDTNKFVIDSGANEHMANTENMFSSLRRITPIEM